MPNIRFIYLNFDNSLAPYHLKTRRSEDRQASVVLGNRDASIATTEHNKTVVDIIGRKVFRHGAPPLRMRAGLRSRIAGIPFGCTGFRGKRTIDIQTDCLVIEFGGRVRPRAERRSQLATIAVGKNLLFRGDRCFIIGIENNQ